MKVHGNTLKVGDRVRHGSIAGEIAEIVATMNGREAKIVLIREASGHEHEARVRELERA